MTPHSVLWQALGFGAAILVVVVAGRIGVKTPETGEPRANAVAAQLVSLFCVVSPALAFKAQWFWKYALASFAGAVALALFSVLAILLISEGGLRRMQYGTIWYLPAPVLFWGVLGCAWLARQVL